MLERKPPAAAALDDAERAELQDLRLQVEQLRTHAAQAHRDNQALQERERRMALALDNSGTGTWDRDVVTGHIDYSPAWKAILGYGPEELTPRIEQSYTRLHPDDLPYVQAAMQAHFEGKTESYAVEHRIRCKDGSYKWISSRGRVVSRDASGRALRMVGTTTDITELRTLAGRLQQSVDLITSLTDEVPGLVFQYRLQPDGKMQISYASDGIRDIYELTPQQVADDATPVHRLVHHDDFPGYRQSLEASAAHLTPWHFQFRVVLPRQGLRWREGDARPRRLPDGSIVWHGFITDVTERKRIETELQEFATIDFLTQLPNRRHFMGRMEEELSRMQRGDSLPAAVLMCDLDHFKLINDSYGHAVGDRMLRHFATLLRQGLRASDIVGRVGGEEFAATLPGADLAQARAFAQRLQARIAQAPLSEGSRSIALTVSIGVTIMNAADCSADMALSRSDLALYQAKKNGRNRIEETA